MTIDSRTLRDSIRTLLKSPADARSQDRIERTLTDGYAKAMSLEAERLKIERRIADVASEITDDNREQKTTELAALSHRLSETIEELEALRMMLAALRDHAAATQAA
jgi:ABC-type phosphate transport system auxiliary subunit